MKILKRLKKDFWQICQDFGFKVRSKTAVGIDFGKEAIRGVRIRGSKEGIEILDVIIQRPLNLKEFLTKLNLASDEEVYINFSDAEILIKRVSLPEMNEQELKGAIRWELKDQLSFKTDEAVLDFKIIGKRNYQDGSMKLDILAIFAKETQLEQNLSTLLHAGINVSGVSCSSLALARLVSGLNLGEPICLIDIGFGSTRLSIIEKDSLQFVRELNLGGEDITRAMTGTLTSAMGRLELSRDEAERLKIESGIPFDNPQLFSMIRPVLERLTNHIRISLEYYESQFDSKEIKKIFLTGNASRLKGLKGFLKEALSKEIFILGLPDKVSFNVRQPIQACIDEILPEISVALGLAMDKDSPNLLPESLRIQKKKHLERFILRTSTILLLSFSLFSYSISAVRLDSLRKVFIALQSQWHSIEEIEKLQNNINNLRLAAQRVCFQEMDSGEILGELSLITPKEISFKQVHLNKLKRVLELKGTILGGNQAAVAGISEFMTALEGSKFFEKVSLVSTQEIDEFKVGASEFELVCNLSPEK